MSNRVGKSMNNRVEVARAIISLVTMHREMLLDIVAGRMGLDRATWEAFVDGQVEELAKVTDALWEISLRLANERSDDSYNRTDRDRCVNELVEKLGGLRTLLDSISPGLSKRYGLSGETPRVPTTLISYCYTVLEILRNAGQTYTMYGAQITTAAMADDLASFNRALESTLHTVTHDKQTEESLLIMRDRILEDWERMYFAVGGFAGVLFEFIGEAKLAKRVRPSATRASGRDSGEDEDSSNKPSDSGKKDDPAQPKPEDPETPPNKP